MITLTDAEKIAENAAEKALLKMLVSLGMDAANPLELQRDFHFLRSLRQESQDTARAIRQKLINALLVAALAGTVAVSTPQVIDRPRDLPAQQTPLPTFGAQP